MTHHSRHEQNDNHRRQQPNRANNNIAWKGQVNSADGENSGYCLSAWLWFINVLWHLCFFRINEFRPLINTRADRRVQWTTSPLLYLGRSANVVSFAFLRDNTLSQRA